MDDTTAPQDLRVSNAEREHVAELLTNHFAAGRLSTEEYAERSDSAAMAATRKDLNRVLVDLPGAGDPPGMVHAEQLREVGAVDDGLADARRVQDGREIVGRRLGDDVRDRQVAPVMSRRESRYRGAPS